MSGMVKEENMKVKPSGRSGDRVFNFSPGPAMLPYEVMTRVQSEFLNYGGLGASIIEISHRSKDFVKVVEEATSLFRELTSLPENYSVLFVHGGGRMQFAAVPMNLIARKPARKAAYVETGVFSGSAIKDAAPYGAIETIASSRNVKFVRIPDVDVEHLTEETSYLHITTNNTAYGTRWNNFPDAGDVPLVGDATSEILSRVVDYSRFGLVYAGLQKNLGPPGTAIVVVRKDLLGHALPTTPPLLNYAVVDKGQSLVNTPSTFNIYFAREVMRWIRDLGGVGEMERRNNQKAQLLYDLLDRSTYYKPLVDKEHRSTMNVTFDLPTPERLEAFLKEAEKEGLHALKGYREVGGVRASIYNGMPREGVQALVSFMQEFERVRG
ncbi:MAG TPA: 3-phosphoserine/phosphohydroxythreonine transaminase [Terriglobia bacterium]|nr:3-phosphoserine/phosphohydroxythreonine transaminase [Terriglobia bacterium]